jgi:hypothetical protein
MIVGAGRHRVGDTSLRAVQHAEGQDRTDPRSSRRTGNRRDSHQPSLLSHRHRQQARTDRR